MGLSLNHSKCEIIGLAPSERNVWAQAGFQFTATSVDSAIFLGSPLNAVGVDSALEEAGSSLRTLTTRLERLSAHEAYHLLKVCFAVPKLQYLLRSAPAFNSPAQAQMSDAIKAAVSASLNIRLEGSAWDQASLPVRWGGIGVREIRSLAPSAFLSSSNSTAILVSSILPPFLASRPDPLIAKALAIWSELGGGHPPSGADAALQRPWDEAVCSAVFNNLLLQADMPSRARLLAVSAPDAGAWLHALPIRNLGLALSNRELRIAAGLRLGALLVRRHSCVCCGVEVDPLGHHGLSCRKSAGRLRRHTQANEILARALRAAEALVELEPKFLFKDDGRKPDGATLDPWRAGRHLVWDFTCPDTLAPSHLAHSAAHAGSAARSAETSKNAKYSRLRQSDEYIFVPVAVESLGTWGPSASELCKEIGARLVRVSGDIRALPFLKQRLGLAVQRGNAASISGTSPQSDVLE